MASPFSELALGIFRAAATSDCSLGEGPKISTTYRCPEKFRCPSCLPFRSPKPCSVTSSSCAARRACGESRIDDHAYYMLCTDLSIAQNVASSTFRSAPPASPATASPRPAEWFSHCEKETLSRTLCQRGNRRVAPCSVVPECGEGIARAAARCRPNAKHRNFLHLVTDGVKSAT